MKEISRLVIVSHVVHYQYEGNLYAYGPYAREIDIWADLFPEVLIASPCRYSRPAGDSLPFTRKNIAIYPISETGGEKFSEKLRQLILLPKLVWDLAGALKQGDAVHIRCPGNLGLLGIILAPLFSNNLIAKYAGQWTDYPGEAFSYRLQKRILRSFWFRGPVTVYGSWQAQPSNVKPFFTSILSEQEMVEARSSAGRIMFHAPMRILFVGRLSASKNVHILIESLSILHEKGVDYECRILGDGPMRLELETLVKNKKLSDHIIFMGAVPHSEVFDSYKWADVLVLASETEGWPKSIAEGMAFGLLCIGSNRGFLAQMIGDKRGIMVEPGNPVILADTIHKINSRPEHFLQLRVNSATWAQQFTLEGLRDSISALLSEEWGVKIIEWKK